MTAGELESAMRDHVCVSGCSEVARRTFPVTDSETPINVNLSPNTYFNVPAGSIADGYFEVCQSSTGPCASHWKPEDNGSVRGVLTTFHQSTWVKSPWGVFISNTLSIPELSQAMRDHGCVNGCSDIVERTIE